MQLESPLDMHIHFRDGEMLKTVAPLSAATFAGGVIMPNLVPPVDSLDRLEAYRQEILDGIKGHVFEPYMTLFFRDYTEAELAKARERIIGIKLYPAGATTNSEAGVAAIDQAEGTIALLEEMGIPLLVHGETHGFVLDREKEFLSVYKRLATRFPRLKIVMEHITTAAAVELLDRHPNLHATVTLQHLIITLDDVAGGLLASPSLLQTHCQTPPRPRRLAASRTDGPSQADVWQRLGATPPPRQRMLWLRRRGLHCSHCPTAPGPAF